MENQTLSEQIKTEICLALGSDPSHPPSDINPVETAIVLPSTEGTLAVWRSTGRHSLKFYKIGSRVRYRLADIAEWKAERLNESGAIK